MRDSGAGGAACCLFLPHHTFLGIINAINIKLSKTTSGDRLTHLVVCPSTDAHLRPAQVDTYQENDSQE